MRGTDLFLSALLFAACSAASAAVPEWVREIAKTPVNASSYADEVNAVILLSDEHLRVQPNGDMIWSMHRAVKILRPQGRDEALLPVPFDKDSKILSLHAYGINQQGQEFEAKEKEAYEVNVSGAGELYGDERNKVIQAPAGDPGSVIAFEVEQKLRPYVHEARWVFQEDKPVLLARYTVSLPAGWAYSNTFLHHVKVEATSSGDEFVWQVSGLPGIHEEHRMPSRSAVAGRMVIHLFGPGLNGKSNRNWAEVGAWQSELSAGRRAPSPEIQETVRQVTATAPDFETKVRALTLWMQRQIRYVAIEIGVGGWQPHAAAAVFHSRYGDCKDKATLLSTMLKEAGIDSEYVLAYYGSRSHVQPDGASAFSFNHAFVAIRLPGNEFKGAPAVVKDKSGQRWLLFDPTDEYLQAGSIEGEMQGSHILLIHNSSGELIEVPLAPAERNAFKRSGKLELAVDGSLRGDMLDVLSGDYAEGLRARMLAQKPEDRGRGLEHALSEQLGNIKLEDYSVENLEDCYKDLRIHYKFSAANYSKNAGALVLVRPRVFGVFGATVDKDQKPRQYAYEFPFVESRTDDFEIALPAGYTIDELPKPVASDFGFATYTAKAEVNGNQLHYTRALAIKDPEIPVEKIDDVRRLFHAISLDERGTAVFKKAD